MKFKLNKKGDSESFETFRLLVAFVLAAAVLVIIISMIHNTHNHAIIISNQKLKEGITSAAKSTGTSAKIPFVIEDLILKGTISKTTISNYSGLPPECIALVYGSGIEPLNPNNDNNILKIKASYLEMDVYAYCNFQDFYDSGLPLELTAEDPTIGLQLGSSEDCPTYCVFFFNKKPHDTLYTSSSNSSDTAGSST